MTEKIGSFGTLTYEGSNMNINIEAESLGSLMLTSSDGQIECFWDGTQWVCQSVSFSSSSQTQAQAPEAV